MVFQASDIPQVTVTVNGIPSACNSSSCGYEWTEADTPTVISVTPESGTS